jgi:hypothetical protein
MVFDTREMMRKLLKGAMVLIIFFVITIPSCNLLHWFERQNYYTGVLPSKLEISGSILIADLNILQNCHFAVYKLSDKTLNSINREGLAFFADQTKGRDYRKENRNNDYYIYDPWKQTVSTERTGGAARTGNACAENLGFDNSILKKIYLAHREGSFYTVGYRKDLVVLPKEGIAYLSGIQR